jgi:hypothetical protein
LGLALLLAERQALHIGGFGAQLESRQWHHPKPGDERKIGGLIFRPYNSRRQFLWLFRDSMFPIPTPIARVSVSWTTTLPADLDEANFCLLEFKERLGTNL